ncbi:hypothetical protein [Aeromicrobium sp. NPDC092404]|uniref:hypothetical protein n=1 Tax=Aeromicrobium sp. NPDC092404 TaxID=3154976 RepID=UPI00342D3D25
MTMSMTQASSPRLETSPNGTCRARALVLLGERVSEDGLRPHVVELHAVAAAAASVSPVASAVLADHTCPDPVRERAFAVAVRDLLAAYDQGADADGGLRD